MSYTLQKLPKIDNVKSIFFIGVKGVGTAPLAIIAKQAGFRVCGSDISEEFITDEYLKKEEINIFEGFLISDIKLFFGDRDRDECLVITTGAHKGFSNPQALWAKENGISVISQGQALGIFMDGEVFKRNFDGVSVAGSHGKTTITALLATSLFALEQYPSYTVGTGELFPLGSPGHLGKGEYFIAEADEYSSEPVFDKVPKFLYQNPKFAIFNNIDFDHPDLFPDISSIENAFLEFAQNIKSGGKLFVNGDDKYLCEFKKKINKDIRIVSYGKDHKNDYVIKNIISEDFISKFNVSKHGKDLGVFTLNIPGLHNALNAISVIAFLVEAGFEYQKIREALKVFNGTKRRMEVIGKTLNGAIIIDDYGHHPLEISTTLKAIQRTYPNKKIIAIFQPHTYSRTKSLLSEFADSFKGIEKLILLPIFKSQRDNEEDNVSLDDYIDAHKTKVANTEYFEKFSDVVKYMRQNYTSDDNIILTIGAGDVYKIGYDLKEV